MYAEEHAEDAVDSFEAFRSSSRRILFARLSHEATSEGKRGVLRACYAVNYTIKLIHSLNLIWVNLAIVGSYMCRLENQGSYQYPFQTRC